MLLQALRFCDGCGHGQAPRKLANPSPLDVGEVLGAAGGGMWVPVPKLARQLGQAPSCREGAYGSGAACWNSVWAFALKQARQGAQAKQGCGRA